MEFRIADTFTDSLARLTGQEQKAVKTAAFDLQLNPANPGHRFHKLDRSKDPHFWSVSVNRDIRLIVHRTRSGLLLCYVGHHDDAYAWAERRKIERHPRTGAAQLVEIRERVEEIVVHQPVAAPELPPASTPLFADLPDNDLLGYGVPEEWMADVRRVDEDGLLTLADHLPQEAAEALLELATGGAPQPVAEIAGDADPFQHPDAQRRFRILTDAAELERALAFPWEKWTVFLHPAQRHLVERGYNGPARVSGSAGAGKTIVALHRAVHLARRHPGARILLTTFSKALATALRTKLTRLAGNEPDVSDRIQVRSITGIGAELYARTFGDPRPASPEIIRSALTDAADARGEKRFSESFLFNEWSDIVDARQLKTWEAYRDVPRLGRKTRIGGKQRESLWSIFKTVQETLDRQGATTWAGVFGRMTDHLRETDAAPFDFAVVDEAQDIGIPELRFLAALGNRRPDALFFAGDLGQRIFQQPFSWKALGVDIRGRSHTLRLNYRTTHQIRRRADRLLSASLSDVDGNVEERLGTVSVFNGPDPTVREFDAPDAEIQAVGGWIADRLESGLRPHEIGVFVRSRPQLDRAMAAVAASGATPAELDESSEPPPDRIMVGAMHLAKGLEFRAVAVMACDDEIIPSQDRIETVSDESDLEEVYNTERHLLYVACTRARDHLLATGVDPASEFLEDMV